jgi:hypothetical protein
MVLMAKVQALIAGIDDPRARVDVAATIKLLADLYVHGRIGEDDLRRDLTDVVRTVVSYTMPDLLEEDIRDRVELIVDDLVRAIKIEGLRMRALSGARGKGLF